MNIDLLVDIAHAAVEVTPAARLPALEKCLARGDAAPIAGSSFPDVSLALYGMTTQDAPIAALTLAGDGIDPGQDYWLRADPMCYQATINRLVCLPLPDDDLSPEDANELAQLLGPHLQSLGFELLVPHPQRWYVRCPSPQRLVTSPPPTGAHPLNESVMPAGADSAAWQRLMTELQMLLHSAEVNARRETDGRLPVTGVWFWGGGSIGTIVDPPYGAVYSDDALVRGLGCMSRCEASSLGAGIETVLTRGVDLQSKRILIAASDRAAHDLARFDTQWVQPLIVAVEKHRVEQLRILLVGATAPRGRLLARSHLRRWWRRSRPLRAYA
jgi:hypothetical protein